MIKKAYSAIVMLTFLLSFKASIIAFPLTLFNEDAIELAAALLLVSLEILLLVDC